MFQNSEVKEKKFSTRRSSVDNRNTPKLYKTKQLNKNKCFDPAEALKILLLLNTECTHTTLPVFNPYLGFEAVAG
jgi:hypothetical protein